MSDETLAAMSAGKKDGASPQGVTPKGVTPDGIQDTNSLTVRGWQRAGALVRLFAPVNGAFVNSLLATPTKRFDLVWVFDLDPASGHYHFAATTQLLLPGDKAHVKDVAED
ncbi:MAG: hypothetical protein U0641_09060 [Anaerolineae bacterium]